MTIETLTLLSSTVFGVLLIGWALLVWLLHGRKTSYSHSIIIALPFFALGVLFIVAPPFPYPLNLYLIISILLVLPILYAASDFSIRTVKLVDTIYAIIYPLAFINYPFLTSFSYSWVIATTPLLLAVSLIHLESRASKIINFALITVASFSVAIYYLIMVSSEYIAETLFAFVFYWSLMTSILALYFRYMKNSIGKFVKPREIHNIFRYELKRKGAHLAFLLYLVVAYIFGGLFFEGVYLAILATNPEVATTLEPVVNDPDNWVIFLRFAIVISAIPFMFNDFLRLCTNNPTYPAKNYILQVMREREKNDFMASSYLFSALSFIVFFLGPCGIIGTFTILVFADSMAAIVGIKYGVHKIGNKSLEGYLSGFLVASICVIPLIPEAYLLIIIPFITIFADWISDKVSVPDNFLIPMFVGAIFYFIGL